MTAAYNRLTKDGVMNHRATMMLGEDGETEADLAFVLTEEDGSYTLDGAMNEVDDGKEKPILTVKGVLTVADGKADGWLALLADETQITFTYAASVEGDSTAPRADGPLCPGKRGGRPSAGLRASLFSLRLKTTENADDSALKAIEAATGGDRPAAPADERRGLHRLHHFHQHQRHSGALRRAEQAALQRDRADDRQRQLRQVHFSGDCAAAQSLPL